MGLFDFLKGKPKRREPKTMQEALDALGEKLGGQPRFWHYFMSHVALRDIALRGEGLPPSSSAPERAEGFFAMILGKMAPEFGLAPAEAERLAADFAISHRRIGDLDVAFVELPPPEGPTECHYVALVPAGGGQPARFFTLEDAGGGVTMLGGWSADEKHLNLGEGPTPTLDNFAEAVRQKL